ncbi:hypothetical protein UFOVP698_30 [uncultured Caudovirales phage]|uniref:Uncharacterized protein n=1 Tax=uncultured Caudovirales phage TaxID=2100421 RepID=A0A6J5NLZ6_9CAUD|nr:hypothetical protein UFOVP698_30 [uncultured Caudovirales phage]
MQHNYTVDDTKLTIGDLVKLQAAKDDLAVTVSILRKCVEVSEGSFEDIPAKHFPAIVKAVLGSLTPSMGN